MNIHVNIFKIYTVCVCIYKYIINIHSTHTHYVNKTFILDAINHLTTLIYIFNITISIEFKTSEYVNDYVNVSFP